MGKTSISARIIPAAAVLLLLAGWFSPAASAQADTSSAGYAAKAALTGKLTSDKMKKGLVSNSLDVLSGQTAGVTVAKGNSAAMLNTVRVRGTTSLTGGNDPLVIIDGVSSDLAMLNTIYPADIESFTILKDASETAQYGSRGASGVIEVRTKRGSGEAFHISYNGNYGIERAVRFVDMLDAAGFRSAASAMGLSFPDLGYDTDFQRELTRTGTVSNHHLAFGGGTSTASYRASIGIQDRSTVIRTNSYRNYVAKLDVDQKAFDGLLDVSLGIFGSLQRNSVLHDEQKLFYSAAAFNPTYPSFKRNGSWDQIASSSQINNPLSLLDKDNDQDDAHFNAHLRFVLRPAAHLELSGFGSYTYSIADISQYFPTSVWSHGQAYRSEDKFQNLLGNVSLSFTNEYGEHHVEVLALAEAEKKILGGFATTVTGFVSDLFGYNNLKAGSTRPWDGTSSYTEESSLVSFMVRTGYVYGGKYALTANARADASSKFGSNHRWGFFPSVSATWIVSREPFLENAGWISDLKISAGYGLSGNQDAIGPYNSLLRMGPVGLVSVGGDPTVTLGVLRNANPDLKWEVRSTANAGFIGSFFGDRLSLAADWYWSKTTDMLYNYDVSVPPFVYNKLLANLGSMSNSGLEIGVGGNLISSEDISLNLNVNVSFQRNKLISLSGWYNGEYLEAPSMAAISVLNGAGFHGGGYNEIVFQAIGQPLGVFYLPKCTGLIRESDGTCTYGIADLDGDGTIDLGADRYIAGQAVPKAVMGANLSFRWRRADLSVQFNGAFGHKIFNGTALSYMNMGSLPYYNVMTGAPEKNIADQTVSDYWLERGDYVNVDYVTVGWNFPLDRARYLRSLRLSVSVNNVATLTGYSGLTPMINSSIVNGTLGLDDKVSFPVCRTWSAGLSIQF